MLSLSLEVGTSNRSCWARIALRIRVKRSAIGSVMLIIYLLADPPSGGSALLTSSP